MGGKLISDETYVTKIDLEYKWNSNALVLHVFVSIMFVFSSFPVDLVGNNCAFVGG